MEVADLLKKFKPKCSGALLKHSMDVSDPVIEFDEVEKMLMREKKEFEVLYAVIYLLYPTPIASFI